MTAEDTLESIKNLLAATRCGANDCMYGYRGGMGVDGCKCTTPWESPDGRVKFRLFIKNLRDLLGIKNIKNLPTPDRFGKLQTE